MRKKITNPKLQKKRKIPIYTFLKKKKINRIISFKGGRFEFIYFFYIKKIYKRICKKQEFKYRHRKVYFLCTCNFPMTKKSKNSRMGSGKGYFSRWFILLRKNSTVVENKNIPALILNRIVLKWNLTLPFKVCLVDVDRE